MGLHPSAGGQPKVIVSSSLSFIDLVEVRDLYYLVKEGLFRSLMFSVFAYSISYKILRLSILVEKLFWVFPLLDTAKSVPSHSFSSFVHNSGSALLPTSGRSPTVPVACLTREVGRRPPPPLLAHVSLGAGVSRPTLRGLRTTRLDGGRLTHHCFGGRSRCVLRGTSDSDSD